MEAVCRQPLHKRAQESESVTLVITGELAAGEMLREVCLPDLRIAEYGGRPERVCDLRKVGLFPKLGDELTAQLMLCKRLSVDLLHPLPA
jgi:hypothetical protein